MSKGHTFRHERGTIGLIFELHAGVGSAGRVLMERALSWIAVSLCIQLKGLHIPRLPEASTNRIEQQARSMWGVLLSLLG